MMLESLRQLQYFVLLTTFASFGWANYNHLQNCSTLKSGGHRCFSGDCIELSQLCDGQADCVDASDETTQLCDQIWCPGYSFRCNYGACISSTAVCDGQSDCIDGSDEQRWLCRAQTQQANCDNGEFFCYPGQCLPYDKLCDGKADCLYGDDEVESLCEGVSSSTATSTAREEEVYSTTMEEHTVSSSSGEEQLVHCVIPQLTKVIIKNKSSEAILPVGSSVPNGTIVYYDCPADHLLNGAEENFCVAPKWLQQFPYCRAPISWAHIIIIALIVITILILVLLIFLFRKSNKKQQEEHIWLVESNNEARNVEKL